MKLDEKTTIPLVSAIAALPILVGGIFWLSSISSRADQSIRTNEKHEQQLVEHGKTLQEIRDTVIRIEERMKKPR